MLTQTEEDAFKLLYALLGEGQVGSAFWWKSASDSLQLDKIRSQRCLALLISCNAILKVAPSYAGPADGSEDTYTTTHNGFSIMHALQRGDNPFKGNYGEKVSGDKYEVHISGNEGAISVGRDSRAKYVQGIDADELTKRVSEFREQASSLLSSEDQDDAEHQIAMLLKAAGDSLESVNRRSKPFVNFLVGLRDHMTTVAGIILLYKIAQHIFAAANVDLLPLPEGF